MEENKNETNTDPIEEIRDYSAEIVDFADIMTSLQGRIYNMIVSGGEASARSEDNFFCWATPGIAVTPDDFTFVSEGLRGTMRLDKMKIEHMEAATKAQAILQQAAKRAVEEAKKEGAESEGGENAGNASDFVNLELSEEEINSIRADKTFNLYLQAESLSRLVDFIPDVSGWQKEGGNKLSILENDGGLSDVYKYALERSQVKKEVIDEATQKLVDEYRGKLEQVVKMPPAAAGLPEEEMTTPTRLVTQYIEKMQEYEDAALELKELQAEAMGGNDPVTMHRFATTAKILQNRVDAAMNAWLTVGYKRIYENMAATIDQVESGSTVMMKEEYRRLLDKAYMTSIGSGMEFLYTTLSPMNFAKARSWMKMSFTRSDYNRENEMSGKNSGLNVDASARVGFVKAKAHVDEKHSENQETVRINMKNFKMEFEICQVNIVRPWFKPSFLNSRFWRFKPGNTNENGEDVEILSSGAPDYKGMMPAYPTSIIFIRDLTLQFNSSSDARDFLDKYNKLDHSGSVSAGWGFVKAKGGYNYTSSNNERTNNKTTKQIGSKITIDGMQIIGYRCHVLGKSPNPLTSITEWI